MTHTVARADVEAFYRALGGRDHVTVARYLAEDVEWTIGGPVDLIKFCGTYRGKATVLDVLERKIPSILGTRRIVADNLLVDGNRAAALGRLIAEKDNNGRAISYRLAQFFSFCDGLVIKYCSVLDSFDAVEQMIGHRIDLAPGLPAGEVDSDLFAV